jgi:hypothetical protein
MSAEECADVSSLVVEPFMGKYRHYTRELEEYQAQRQAWQDLSPEAQARADTLFVCKPYAKTCEFTQLYYDTENGRFFINRCNSPFPTATAPPVEVNDVSVDDYDDDAMFVMSPTGFRLNPNGVDHYSFEYRCMQDIAPTDTSPITSASVYGSKTVILTRRFIPSNAGHLILETALPIEKVASLYGVTSVSDRVVLFDDDCGESSLSKDELRNREALLTRCALFTDNFIAPLSNTPIQTTRHLQSIAKSRNNSRFLSLQRVVVGTGYYSPYERAYFPGEMAHVHATFRQRIYRHAGVKMKRSQQQHGTLTSNTSSTCIANKRPTDDAIINTGRVKQRLTFIYKIGIRMILNHEDTRDYLQAWCVVHNYEFVYINLAAVSFERQIQIIAQTDVLLSVGGAASFASYFLPDGAILVYFPVMISCTLEMEVCERWTPDERIIRYPGYFTVIDYVDYDPGVLETSRMDNKVLEFDPIMRGVVGSGGASFYVNESALAALLTAEIINNCQ